MKATKIVEFTMEQVPTDPRRVLRGFRPRPAIDGGEEQICFLSGNPANTDCRPLGSPCECRACTLGRSMLLDNRGDSMVSR